MKDVLSSHCRHQGEQGFTIVEALIAIVILAVGLLAVAAMQVSSIRGNFLGGNTSIALSLASERMEDLLNKDITHADLVDTAAGNNGDLTSLTTVDHQEVINDAGVEVAGGFYRRVTNIADSASPTMKTITVMVTWENNKHRVTVTTIKQQ